MENTTFWDVTQYSSIEIHEDFKQTYCFHPYGQGVCQASNQQEGSKRMSGWSIACLAYTMTLKMEAVQPSEISANFYWITMCYHQRYMRGGADKSLAL
jgi:hypothetical protein